MKHAACILTVLVSFFAISVHANYNCVFVETTGNDAWNGSVDSPVYSLDRAIELACKMNPDEDNPVLVKFGQGTYHIGNVTTISVEHVYFAGNGYNSTRLQGNAIVVTTNAITAFQDVTLDTFLHLKSILPLNHVNELE